MKHTLNITVSKERQNSGIMACRQLILRERLLRFLLGAPVKLTVIIHLHEEVMIWKNLFPMRCSHWRSA